MSNIGPASRPTTCPIPVDDVVSASHKKDAIRQGPNQIVVTALAFDIDITVI